MSVSLHVAEKLDASGPVSLHPTQGALPDLKLVSQPPLQLLAAFSSSAIFACTETGFASIEPGVCAVSAVGRDATVACAGRGLSFGATTVMLGSGVATPVSGCDIAGALRLHSNAVDRIAIPEGATKRDDELMMISDQIRTDIPSRCVPRYHAYFN